MWSRRTGRSCWRCRSLEVYVTSRKFCGIGKWNVTSTSSASGRSFSLTARRSTRIFRHTCSTAPRCCGISGSAGRGVPNSDGLPARRTPPFICGSLWRGSCRACAGEPDRHEDSVRHAPLRLRAQLRVDAADAVRTGTHGRPGFPDRRHALAPRSVRHDDAAGGHLSEVFAQHHSSSRRSMGIRRPRTAPGPRLSSLPWSRLPQCSEAARTCRTGGADYLLERTKRGPGTTPAGRTLLGGTLRTLLRAIPTDARIDAFLEVHRPDVIALTPLIEPGAPQAEYVRSARALRIPTALCVASWDNLTNKGLIHGPVDLITVWNAMMKEEAITHHGVPEEKIVVTGAQPFDHWFGWQPSVGREAFCRQVGLPPDRPYILYVCSSRFIAPEEVPFVRSWLQHLRQSGVCAGVLIRPHPQNAEQWRHADLREYGPAVVWPLAGATPSDTESRGDYFNSIVHSAAVIGINTTAEIESAIVGRGVLTILAPEFQATQEGTLHFEHLRRADGGLVRVAQTFSEHVEQLNETLRSEEHTSE